MCLYVEGRKEYAILIVNLMGGRELALHDAEWNAQVRAPVSVGEFARRDLVVGFSVNQQAPPLRSVGK
jgi:hypothetical protein